MDGTKVEATSGSGEANRKLSKKERRKDRVAATTKQNDNATPVWLSCV